MPHTVKQIIAGGWLCAAILSSAACAPKRIPPMTVSDLMEDRVTLDGVLMKCNENPSKARSDSDCMNARIAIARLAKDVDPAEEAKRNAEFEHSRERLRLAQEKVRQEQEARTKVDPYNLPLVPVDSTPPSAAQSGSDRPR
ncbi:MAG: EexN family lipoprotein [Pseudomonadota bacterium]|nr:EexN family lipoprotein [Pseudomonadota bacterium]